MRTETDVTVVVPVRNGERWIDGCLGSVTRSNVREIIVVDGMSTDGTVAAARRHGARVLSDEGRGLPAARQLGAEAATTPLVALVDVHHERREARAGACELHAEELRDGRWIARDPQGLHDLVVDGHDPADWLGSA